MKLIIIALCLVTLTGCLIPNGATRLPANSSAVKKDGTIVPPRMGMTKSQVLENYGKPGSIHSTPQGETWSYAFDQLKFPIWTALGQYESIYTKSRSGSITFNSRGTVSDYYFGENVPAARPHF